MKKEYGSSATASADRHGAAGKTDWARLRTMSDADVRFTADAPATKAQDWTAALAHRGLPLPVRKEQIALRVDTDVLAALRNTGRGWQTRINAVLREAVQTGRV